MMVAISIFLLGLSLAHAQVNDPFSIATRPPLQEDGDLHTRHLTHQTCSYTPDTFNFELMFNKNCNDETLSENEGIDGTLCYFNYGVTPEYVDPEDFTFGDSGGSRRGLLRTGQEAEESTIDKMQRVLAAENDYKHAMVHSHYKHATSVQGQRAVQVNDPYPTVITSVVSYWICDVSHVYSIIVHVYIVHSFVFLLYIFIFNFSLHKNHRHLLSSMPI